MSKLWMNIEWHVFMAHGVYNYTVLNCIVKKTCLWQNLKSGCAVYSVGKTKQTNVTYIQSFSHNTQLVHTSLRVARGTNHTQRNVLQVDMLWCECGVGQKCAAESNVVTSTGESLTCTVSLILPVTPSQSFLSCHSSSQSHTANCLVLNINIKNCGLDTSKRRMTSKTAKITKRWYYSTAHRLNINWCWVISPFCNFCSFRCVIRC